MEIKYDAFISYKHEKTDIFVAEQLQKLLEHYKIPRKIQKSSGKKQINRIFRDTEELSVAPDLTEKIQDALLHSEFLILICSPESLQSEWVKKELDFFLQTHDKNNVLAVLVKGEPENAFPETLLFKEETFIAEDGNIHRIKTPTEPLAANVKGNSEKEIKKRLKVEYLRLLAPMLYCSYDQLKMRHREYILRRNLTIAGTAAVFAFLFAAYTLWQSFQIQKQYEQARENQARYLSNISLELFSGGDRMTALQTALAIAPEEDSDGAVVPEQLYALNTALYSYNSPATLNYKPYSTGDIDNYSSGNLSPDGSYFFAIGHYGSASFLNADTGESFWKITVNDFLEKNTKDTSTKFNYGIPVSETHTVLFASKSIFYVNVTEKKLENTIRIEDSISINWSQKNSTVSDELLAFTQDNHLFIYNLVSGELIKKTTFADATDNYTNYGVQFLCFSPSHDTIAIGFEEDAVRNGLVLYSIENDSYTILSNHAAEKLCFIDDTYVAAIQYIPTSSIYDTGSDYYQNNEYFFAIYDIVTQEQILCSDRETFLDWGHTCGLYLANAAVNGQKSKYLLTYINGRLKIVNLNTYEIVSSIVYDSVIKGIAQYDASRFFVGMEDGKVQILSMNNSLSKQQMTTINASISGFYYSSTYNTILQIADEKIIINAFAKDEQLNQLNTDELSQKGYTIDDVEYYNAGDYHYRCLILCQKDSYAQTAFAVYPTGSDEYCFFYETSETAYTISSIAIGLRNNIPVLCCLVNDSSTEQCCFFMVDLNTGNTLFMEDLSSYSTLSFQNGVQFSNDLSFFVANRTKGGAVIFDILDDGLKTHSTVLIRNKSISNLTVTGDSRYIIFTCERSDYPSKIVYIYDKKEEVYITSDQSICYDGSLEIKSGMSSSFIAVCVKNQFIDIIDCSTGNTVYTISTNYYQSFDYAFFDQDQFLITSIDRTIAMWDITNGTLTMQYITPEAISFTYHILTDNDSSWFAIKDSSLHIHYTTGTNPSAMYIFSVDQKHCFYPYACVDYGYASFSGEEVATFSFNHFYYNSFYDYADLKHQAETFLDGNTLTEAEKRQYFISE